MINRRCTGSIYIYYRYSQYLETYIPIASKTPKSPRNSARCIRCVSFFRVDTSDACNPITSVRRVRHNIAYTDTIIWCTIPPPSWTWLCFTWFGKSGTQVQNSRLRIKSEWVTPVPSLSHQSHLARRRLRAPSTFLSGGWEHYSMAIQVVESLKVEQLIWVCLSCNRGTGWPWPLKRSSGMTPQTRNPNDHYSWHTATFTTPRSSQLVQLSVNRTEACTAFGALLREVSAAVTVATQDSTTHLCWGLWTSFMVTILRIPQRSGTRPAHTIIYDMEMLLPVDYCFLRFRVCQLQSEQLVHGQMLGCHPWKLENLPTSIPVWGVLQESSERIRIDCKWLTHPTNHKPCQASKKRSGACCHKASFQALVLYVLVLTVIPCVTLCHAFSSVGANEVEMQELRLRMAK